MGFTVFIPSRLVVQPWASPSLNCFSHYRDLHAVWSLSTTQSCVVGRVNSPWIHVSADAGAPTYMYEFEYRPSFVSNMRPKAVIGDHGDELFSVFGSPFLKGNVSLLPVALAIGGPDLGPGLTALCRVVFGSAIWAWVTKEASVWKAITNLKCRLLTILFLKDSFLTW